MKTIQKKMTWTSFAIKNKKKKVLRFAIAHYALQRKPTDRIFWSGSDFIDKSKPKKFLDKMNK